MKDGANLLEHLKARAEAAYEAMYEAHSFRAAGASYTDAKDYFYEAIAVARRLGEEKEADRIEARLTEVKAVFRSQFS